MYKTFSLRSLAFFIFSLDTIAIIAVIGKALILQRDPMRYFGEGGLITWISAIQLLAIYVLSWRISRYRKPEYLSDYNGKNPLNFWRILTLGFFF